MAETKKTTPPPAPKAGHILTITAKRDGFRRCGIAHPASPVDHPIERFSKKQIEALRAEPMLVVHEREAAAD